MLNCPNCGAPITAEKCAYCGTVFMDFSAIQLGAPSYVKFKTEQGVYILTRLVVEEMQIVADTDTITYYDGTGAALSSIVQHNGYSIHMDAHTVMDEKLRHITAYITEKEAEHGTR